MLRILKDTRRGRYTVVSKEAREMVCWGLRKRGDPLWLQRKGCVADLHLGSYMANPSSRGVNQSAVSLLQTWNLGEYVSGSSTSMDCIETHFDRVPVPRPALAIRCLVFTAERTPTKETVGKVVRCKHL